MSGGIHAGGNIQTPAKGNVGPGWFVWGDLSCALRYARHYILAHLYHRRRCSRLLVIGAECVAFHGVTSGFLEM